ncbi:MAG: hypothetical protein QOF33_289 [Thermomicrobiales bacterium]|nr:hypothetical protein [Thermomicrobiales bacterium]MEA2582204.1 hypothetical protein [Thermomicrobiales bacterium]
MPTPLRLPRLTVLGLMALVLALQINTASAGISWCRADPGVALNGTVVQIWVAIPLEYQPLVDGPIQVTIKTPRGVDRQLLWTDAGFNGLGEEVTFRTVRDWDEGRRSFPVQIKVSVSAGGRTDIPMQVEIIPDNGDTIRRDGTNGGLSVKTRVVRSL